MPTVWGTRPTPRNCRDAEIPGTRRVRVGSESPGGRDFQPPMCSLGKRDARAPRGLSGELWAGHSGHREGAAGETGRQVRATAVVPGSQRHERELLGLQ